MIDNTSPEDEELQEIDDDIFFYYNRFGERILLPEDGELIYNKYCELIGYWSEEHGRLLV